MLVAFSAPCYAWLYDGGNPTPSGPLVKYGTSVMWVSQPFTLATDSWVTSFGAAVGRAFGNSEMGFNIYLSDRRFDLSWPIMASGTITPQGLGCTYHYVSLDSPVELAGGHKYYLTLVPNSNNFTGTVCYSYKPGVDPGIFTGDYGQNWTPYLLSFGMRVDGYAVVPEADSWLTLAAGLIGLAGLASFRRGGCVSRAGADRA